MASCKDCLYDIVCEFYAGDLNKDGAEKCVCFKDRNRFVELPCKVGDTVYYITGLSRKYIKSANVNEIIINCNGISELFVSTDTVNFENSFDAFYLTREEAEKALKERENNG